MSALAQKTVVVVDDSTLMRRLITEIVEADPDLRVIDVAENGKVALLKVRQHRPDCVLLDVEMPELSGLDTMRRLRLRSSAKVVILSHLGHEGSRVRAEAFRLGAVDVLDKPAGAASRDLWNTRGRIIQQTLRRVLGLAAVRMPDEPLHVDAAAVRAYGRGMDHYEAGQFAKAIKAFDEALRRSPSDRAAARLLARCRALLRTPSATWRGVLPLDGAGG